MENKGKTGYPSIDKPWLKYYSEEALNEPMPNCSLYEYLWLRNKDYLDDNALNYFGNEITYKKLFELIDEAASAFRSLGVMPEDIVSLVTVSTVESIVCFYALNKIGAVSNYLNVQAEVSELKKYFDEAKSRVVVALDLFAEKVLCAMKGTAVEKVVVCSVDNHMPLSKKIAYRLVNQKINIEKNNIAEILNWNDFLKNTIAEPKFSYQKEPHTMCLLAHTGGTTGEPKAVMLSDYAMNAVAAEYIAAWKVRRRGIFLNVTIPFVVYGSLCCTHIPLCMGMCNAIIPKFEAKEWSTYFKTYKPNCIDTVPSFISPMLTDEK